MADLKFISVRHEAIMDFLMANPCIKLGDVAKHFNMTPGWLSQVIHADAFQAMLKLKQGIVFHHTVLPLREKMEALAHAALDRATELVPLEIEVGPLQKLSGDILDRLGYGTKTHTIGGLHFHNHGGAQQVNVQRSELEEARALLVKAASARSTEVIIDGERSPLALPNPGDAQVGAPVPMSFVPGLPFPAPDGETESGAEVRAPYPSPFADAV